MKKEKGRNRQRDNRWSGLSFSIDKKKTEKTQRNKERVTGGQAFP